MTEHLITAHMKVEAATPSSLPRLRHFKNFSVTLEGNIVIKNFHPDFRDKLQAVLLDEDLPFSPILPVVGC